MKGADAPIADPIDPVCPEDNRPSIKALIEEHGVKIAKIRDGIKQHPLYDASKHDDLWILRFWLSHEKSRDAIKAAAYTLEFRKRYNLDDRDVRHDPPPNRAKDGSAVAEMFARAWHPDAFVFCRPDPRRGPIIYIDASGFDQHVTAEFTREDMVEFFLRVCEWGHQWNDYVTRTTGRLTKQIRLLDVSGMALGDFSFETARRYGSAQAVIESCYPQFLETVYLCNPPRIIGTIWRVARHLMPDRMVKKFGFIDPKRNVEERRLLYRHISEAHLAEKYGGKNPFLRQEF